MSEPLTPLESVLGDESIPDASGAPATPGAEAVHQARMRNAALAGATEGLVFGDKHFLHAAVVHLMTCLAHGGVHHFAITGEGDTLWCSQAAIECINNADLTQALLAQAPAETEVSPAHPNPSVQDPSSIDSSIAMPRDRCPDCGAPEVAPFTFAHADDCPSS